MVEPEDAVPPQAEPAPLPADPEPQDQEDQTPAGMGQILSNRVLRIARLILRGDIVCGFRTSYTRRARHIMPRIIRVRHFEPSSVLVAFVLAQVMDPGNILAVPVGRDNGYDTQSDSDVASSTSEYDSD